MKNIDVVCSMSAHDLAAFLISAAEHACHEQYMHRKSCACYCKDCIEEWLEQESVEVHEPKSDLCNYANVRCKPYIYICYR